MVLWGCKPQDHYLILLADWLPATPDCHLQRDGVQKLNATSRNLEAGHAETVPIVTPAAVPAGPLPGG